MAKITMKKLIKHKLVPLIAGAGLFVLGVILIALCGIIGDAITIVTGIVLLCVGVLTLIYGCVMASKAKDYLYNIIFGALNIIFGIVIIIFIQDKIVFMAVASICMLIHGVLEITLATNNLFKEIPWVGIVVFGALKIILGLIIMIKPFGGFNLWTVFVGIYFIIYALSIFFVAALTGEKIVEDVIVDGDDKQKDDGKTISDATKQQETKKKIKS